ncbi:MAG: hypothetical protein ACJA2W_003481, partial [Planctomycetota bacterium]
MRAFAWKSLTLGWAWTRPVLDYCTRKGLRRLLVKVSPWAVRKAAC